nr:hypothetical protein [uncultured Terrisporobacter sp.]
MKSCRIQALIEELIIDWDKLNLAAKLLVYIGFFLIFSTVFISIYKSKNVDLYETIEAIFRTALASVFGFLLSSNIKNSSEKNSQKNKEEAITEECQIKKETDYYYYGEGNTVQVMVALLISVISALIMLGLYIFGFTNNGVMLSQFRDLMCTSIGFLLGEAKIKSKN